MLMWCIRQRLWHSSPLVFVISLFLAGGILFQLRTLYNNHQRYLRLESYTRDLEKLSEEMHTIQRVANTSLKLLKKLENYANEDTQKSAHENS